MRILFVLTVLMAPALLSACSVAGAAAGAGAAVGIASQQEGGISGAADDIRIKALISDQWFRYDVSTFAKLNLTVDQGRVLITGVVQNPDARVQAVRLAWQVEGVKQVINEIRLANSDGFPGFVRDEWITTRLRTALTFDRDVRSINYSIDTVQGTVFLMGTARDQAELDRVVEIARTIPNVRQVISYVRLPGQQPQQVAPGNATMTRSTRTTTTTTMTTTSQDSGAPASLAPSYQSQPMTSPGVSGNGSSASLPSVSKPVTLPP